MTTRRTGQTLALSIPADIAAVSIARLFAASTMRGLGCDEDTIEDIRLAISEGVTDAIRAHSAASVAEPIEVRIDPSDEHIVIEVSDARSAGDGSAEGSDALVEVVIRSLFPDVRFESGARGMTLAFTVPRSQMDQDLG